MKAKLALALTVFGILVVAGLTAQEYLNRQPTPTEARRVAGLNHYPAAANDAVWDVLDPGTNYTWLFLNAAAVGKTNQLSLGLINRQNVILRCTGGGGETNWQVYLPNPTNSVGQVYRVVATGRTIITLTNATASPGNTFLSTTNVSMANVALLCTTNTQVDCYNPYGTNWVVIPKQINL